MVFIITSGNIFQIFASADLLARIFASAFASSDLHPLIFACASISAYVDAQIFAYASASADLEILASDTSLMLITSMLQKFSEPYAINLP